MASQVSLISDRDAAAAREALHGLAHRNDKVSLGGEEGVHDSTVYLHGMRFWLTTISLGVMVFMVNLEIPVVTTSLVAITSDLGGFDRSSWVASSYVLGYSAVIVIFAKFSDSVGRKPIYVFSIFLFLVFSAACSAAQTMTQLLVFRAFQGLGGGGCFSLSTVIITELVPKAQYTKYVSQLSVTSTLALLLGPIVGGGIASHATWRWVFIINVPISLIALGFALVGIPRDFPFQGQPGRGPSSIGQLLTKSTRDRLDFLGAAFLLCAIISLTAGLEEADNQFPWKSAYVITLLVLSGVFWGALLAWERYITNADNVREPVLPWTFLTNRMMVGILLTFLLLGGPAIASVFQLPQRFQIVHGLSGLEAGVRLIPFTLSSPVGAVVAVGIAGRFKIAPLWLILTGAILQTTGFAVLGTLPTTATQDIPSRIYGGEILAGFGVGMSFTLLFLIIPYVVEKRDHAVSMGAGSQFRMMGSAVAVALCTAVFNSDIRSRLGNMIGQQDLNPLVNLTQYLALAPAEEQEKIRQILAEGYNHQMLVLCACAALQIASVLLLWKREQLKV